MPYKDPEKARAYAASDARRVAHREDQRRYRERHPERVYLSQRQDRKRNPDRFHAEDKRYRERHPERLRAKRQREFRVSLAGSRHIIHTLPPELQEIARLLRQTRQAIRESMSGGQAQ